MTDDLITDLSKVSSLFVIARNSSFAYKGRRVEMRQVAEDLGVRYVVEGSVRRAGDTVRVNAQLVDTITADTSGRSATTAASRISSRFRIPSSGRSPGR